MSNVAIAWKFWILWVLVCFGSGFGCFILGLLIFTSRNQNSLSLFVGLSIVGILWVTPQYLLLKNYTPINGIWVLVTAAGMIASLYVAQFVFAVLDRNLGWAVIGAVAAIFQYFVLRQHFLLSSAWILASGAGVAVSVATGEIVFRVVSKAIESPVTGSGGGLSALAEATSVLIYSSLVTGVVALAIYGAITGGALIWLLRTPKITII
ncbi:hypothetical protein [Chlorogloea sp. CCALA 695]|uniref:hypothetical protein n=1 Tax=Chlorogloea sp. CCALA 695 TaxID=2107693 RepID=UPI000D0535B3|nr:hypothetical protein [Chlorogloea sp. CCALA 695]PSB33827.1 hypothetical protein C7B70_05900 [Chlorogloea sp. CCALA 695]